jgi:hypothetical protein
MKILIMLSIFISSLDTFAFNLPFKKSKAIRVTCATGGKLISAKNNTSWYSSYAKKCRISEWDCYPLYRVRKGGLPEADKKGLSSYAISVLEEDCKENSDAMNAFLEESESTCYGFDSKAWYGTIELVASRLNEHNDKKRKALKEKYNYYQWWKKKRYVLTRDEENMIQKYNSAIASLNDSLYKSRKADINELRRSYHGNALKKQCCAGNQCKPL